MDYGIKKQLKRLGQKELKQDIKKYIRDTNEFYNSKIPEMKTLAKRLHEEYKLDDFYKVFNRLWKSGYYSERILSVNALNLYRKDFDLNTWNFLIPHLKKIKDFNEADNIGKIIGIIASKHPKLKKEILKLSRKRDVFLKRTSLASCLSLIENKEPGFALKIAEESIYDKNERVQEIVGEILKEVGRNSKNKESVRKIILRHLNMSESIFNLSTSNFNELKRMRKVKKLKNDKIG